MSISPTPPLARAPGSPRSARHSQQGCQGTREAGATPQAPNGVAPNPVSTAIALGVSASPLSLARPCAVAVLTTFEGQAVFRLILSDGRHLKPGDFFRLRKGSRLHEPRRALS